MNYLKQLGLIFAMMVILIPFAVTPANAQQNGRHGHHSMRYRQDDDNGRRVRRNRNWTHQNRKYWYNTGWKRKHKNKRHHYHNPIRRGENNQ